MRKLSLTAIAGIAVAAAAIAPATASAAVEFGDNCTTNPSAPGTGATLVQLTSSSDPLPLAAPSAGVITRWKMTVHYPPFPGPDAIPQTLKVLRPVGGEEFKVVGESDGMYRIGENAENVFDARIPVQSGDRLGLYGKPFEFGGESLQGLILCESAGTATTGIYEANATLGSVHTFAPGPELSLPLTATIEPDADGDGYGDETQDKCPQSAATHGPCPVVAPPPPPAAPPLVLEALSRAGKKSVTVLVAVSASSPVTVTGTAPLPASGGKARAKRSRRAKKAKAVQLSAPVQTVAPGHIGRFRLAFPRSLRKALKHLPRKRSVTLNLTATAPSPGGAPASSSVRVKVRGQAHGSRHRRHRGRH